MIASRKQSIVASVTTEAENENCQTDLRSLWSRRRKIDGALNRVPPGFYKRVYVTLTHMQGLSIGSLILSHNLTKEVSFFSLSEIIKRIQLFVYLSCTLITLFGMLGSWR